MAMKRKIRMYEPWGYKEENNYQSDDIIFMNDLDNFFSEVSYNKGDKKIHFFNKDNEEKATIDVTEFSTSVVESAVYDKDTKILTITFANGDVVQINLAELIDENEFADGLKVADGVVSVLVDSLSEEYLSVSENGVKVSGVDAAIEAEKNRAEGEEERIEGKLDSEIARATSAETALDEKIDAETARAESAESNLQAAIEAEGQRAQDAEQTLDEKIDQEIDDRIADVDAEETRAKAREDEIEAALNTERTRATQTEGQLNHRIDVVNDELDSEESRAQAAEQELRTNLTTEIVDRKADVDAEEARAKAAEQALQAAIGDESDRAISAETALGEIIDEIASGSSELLEKLGYTDNDTIERNNGGSEVAFGTYNISTQSDDPAQKTLFSIGNGTDDANRNNALEVKQNGDVYLWVEGEFMNMNRLLAQIAHEVYDSDAAANNPHYFDGD